MTTRRRRRPRRNRSPRTEQERGNGKLVEKLGLRGGQVLCLVNPPEGFYARLSNELPEHGHLYLGLPPRPPAHIFVLWPDGAGNLGNALSYLKAMLDPGGAIWVVIPRKRAGRGGSSAISLEQVQQAARREGLMDKEKLSFSGNQHGVRLVFR